MYGVIEGLNSGDIFFTCGYFACKLLHLEAGLSRFHAAVRGGMDEVLIAGVCTHIDKGQPFHLRGRGVGVDFEGGEVFFCMGEDEGIAVGFRRADRHTLGVHLEFGVFRHNHS